MEKLNKFEFRVLICILVQWAVALVFAFVFKMNFILPFVFALVEGIIIYYLIHYYKNIVDETNVNIEHLVSSSAKDALLFSQTGMVTYDEDYVVTFMSDLFKERNIDRRGEKVLSWLPEVDPLISGRDESVFVPLDAYIYEIKRKEDEPVLLFKDITDKMYYQRLAEHEKVVIGLFDFDNYEESTQYEDEAEVSAINNAIRTPLVEYAKHYGFLLRRLTNSRYIGVLSESIYKQLVEDRFSILNTVRKAAQGLDAAITLSIGIARDYDGYLELDEAASRLLDLAQSRGGDQVAVQEKGKDVRYYGGSSEAQEKRSKVRVRIVSHALRDLIQKSSNVIICGHKESDFDCLGSAMGLSRIIDAYHKPCCIIAKTGGIEAKLTRAMKLSKDAISERFTLVSENEALNQLKDNTLVIMTDHHSLRQSNGRQVLEKAKKIVIIDHHRRSAELEVKPILVYIEAGASSSCELVTEFLPYVTNRVDLSELEATIMLAGMTIDTNQFKVRTGARTFEAAGVLRKNGANPSLVDEYLKDTYEDFETKTLVLSQVEQLSNGIVISEIKDRVISRSLISQAADTLLGVKGVEAAFVIARIEERETGITARSNGNLNVQVIMEKMKGGGHRTAAAVQRMDTSTIVLREELGKCIEEYLKENSDEGNLVK
ncbi:MAG: DHH family phosphoesterase [Erysipelotrichaceae bacterium]|nr:DHH family phosphoesterase [Erysipelotrichaceae bacterium]